MLRTRMAWEYVVVGRRPIPKRRKGQSLWLHTFELVDDEEDDADEAFEEGDCAIDEIDSGEAECWSWAGRHAGFTPKAVVAVRKAGWEFSRAVAEVLAAALDGIYFVDATVDEDGIERPIEATAPASSTRELERRIELASKSPAKYFDAWRAQSERACREWAEQNPEDAAQRDRENDWSNI